MGLFKGSIASIVSGKIGGLVYQKNGRIRPYRMPLNPRTTLQDVVRGAFIVSSSLWNTISDPAAQDAWTTWATLHPKLNRLGDSIKMTGKQAMISLNVPRIQAGMDPIIFAPFTDPLNVTATGSDPVVEIAAGDDLIAISGISLGTGSNLAVYVGLPRSISSVRGRKNLTYAGSILGASTLVTTGSVSIPSGDSPLSAVYDIMLVTRTDIDFSYTKKYATVTAA